MRTMRTWLLALGLLASMLVGCAGSPVREGDTLADYRRELAKLVETGVLTKEDEEKFCRIAGLEMERRARQRHQPSGQTTLPRNCRNTWRTTSNSTSRATVWCTTGSTCTTWKRNVSDG
jgi:hypothetical protein